jgi:CRP-like cAMP-binding protein
VTTLIVDFSRLATALMWATSRGEVITVEHLASNGRRTSLESTAHFFLELRDRLDLVGLGAETECECPLSEYVLADALGFSSIHVNHALRQLRELDLMTPLDGDTRVLPRRNFEALSGIVVALTRSARWQSSEVRGAPPAGERLVS